jgi:hypothetical protein
MGQIPGQDKRLVTPLQRLVRIAKRPQSHSCEGFANDSRVLSIEKRQGAMPWEVIKRNPLLLVRSALGKIPQEVRCTSQRPVSLEEGGRILLVLGQTQELPP